MTLNDFLAELDGTETVALLVAVAAIVLIVGEQVVASVGRARLRFEAHWRAKAARYRMETEGDEP